MKKNLLVICLLFSTVALAQEAKRVNIFGGITLKFGANTEQLTNTHDKFIGEWLDTQNNWLAQSYIDVKTKTYKLNVSKTPYANANPFTVLDATIAGETISYANTDGYSASFDKGVLNITGPDGFKFSGKVTGRISPTLNALPPTGADVLFDGTNLDSWGGFIAYKEWFNWNIEASETVKLTPEGNLQIIPGKQSIVSKKVYGDIKHLHLEFRLLGEPTNGGVYMQSRYEFNIKDSWGQGEGSVNGAFGNVVGYKEPKVNYTLPPMVWQTMDIKYTAARFDADGERISNVRTTMYLNGELLYDDAEVDIIRGSGGGKLPLGPLGPVYLQEHGTAYEFRNIWVVEK